MNAIPRWAWFLIAAIIVLLGLWLGVHIIVGLLTSITGMPAGILILVTLLIVFLCADILACKVLHVVGIWRHGSTVALAVAMILVFFVVLWGGGRIWFVAAGLHQWSWFATWVPYCVFWFVAVTAVALWLRVAGFTAKRATVFAFPIAAFLLSVWSAIDDAQYSNFVAPWSGAPLVAVSNCDGEATFGPFSDMAHPVPAAAEFDRLCYVPAADFIELDLSQEEHRTLLRQWDDQGLGVGDNPKGKWQAWRKAYRTRIQQQQAAGQFPESPVDSVLDQVDSLTGGRLGVETGGTIDGTNVSAGSMTFHYWVFFALIALGGVVGGILGGKDGWVPIGVLGLVVGLGAAMAYGFIEADDWLFPFRTQNVRDLPAEVHLSMNEEVTFSLDMSHLKYQARSPVFAYVCEAQYPVRVSVRNGQVNGWKDNDLNPLVGKEIEFQGGLDDGRQRVTFRLAPKMGPRGAMVTDAYIVLSLGGPDNSMCSPGTAGHRVWEMSQSSHTPVQPSVPPLQVTPTAPPDPGTATAP